MLNIKAFIRRYYFLNFIWKVISNFYYKDGLQRANGLAYVLLMSFVPFFITSASIVSLFITPRFYYHLENIMFSDYLPVVGEEVATYMREFQSHAVGLSLISLAFLFITSVSMINNLRSQIDQILEVSENKIHLGFKILFAVSLFLGFIIAGVILLGTREAINYFLPASFLAKLGFIFMFFQYLTSIAAFTIIYKFVPNVKIKTKNAMIAGVSAGVLFELGKLGFAIYIKKFATNHLLYGSLAAIPIFLLWLYIISVILLLCVHILPLLEERTSLRNETSFLLKDNLKG